MRLHCTLVLPNDLDLAGYVARVQVEDTTMADAPAHIVKAIDTPAESLIRMDRRLGPIDLEIEPPPPGRSYTVRGLLTRHPNLGSGDFLSTTSIALRSSTDAGTDGYINIPLTPVP